MVTSQVMQDRRREPRQPASGTVTLTPADAPSFTADLLDDSPSGFRAEYSEAGIRSGTELRVTTASAQHYRVKVAWTIVAGGKSQSGFYRLDD
jgi:hypothetical protein